MKFDASNDFDKQRARARLELLIKGEKRFDIIEKRRKRSISQNSYLHLILTWFAIEYGETMDYVKVYFFKNICNKDLFLTEYVNKKTGEIRKAWKSTADCTDKELSNAVENFRNYSVKEAGIYLPEPNDLASINNLELEISKH